MEPQADIEPPKSRLTAVGQVAGAIAAIAALGVLPYKAWEHFHEKKASIVIGDHNDCVLIGNNNKCEGKPSPSQSEWEELDAFPGPPNGWVQKNNWDAISPSVFPDGTDLQLPVDEQTESGIARLIDGGFELEVSDTNSVTAFLPRWPEPSDAPYYAAVTVEQVGGAVESRACGLLFNGRAVSEEEYESDPSTRWLLVKASGGDVQVTQYTPTSSDGAINHRVYASYENVIDPGAKIRLEVLVLPDRWTAAADGRVVGSRMATMERQLALPAAQQESTARKGNVVCRFTDWEFWGP